MKKLFFITLFLFYLNNLKAQMSNTLCGFNYEINVSPVESELLSSIQEAQMSWDFSNINFNKKLIVTIEIIPIYDCFNNESAVDFKETIRISSNDTKFNKSGGFLFKHIDMMTKCFKWRVIMNSVHCVETSNWQYFSYLK